MIDQQDRHVLGLVLIVVMAFVGLCLVIGAGLGVGVLVFRVVAGW